VSPDGAAYATIGGQILAALTGVFLNARKNPEVNVRPGNLKPDFGVIWSISKISIPSIVMASIGSLMTFLMDLILIGFSSTAVVAVFAFISSSELCVHAVFGSPT
jgi:Na+-driven multidrug efflux pump